LYDVSLKRWLAKFPLEQFHFIDANLFITEPVTVLRGIETFFGITPQITESMVYYDEEKGYYCMVGKQTWCESPEKGHKFDPISEKAVDKLTAFFRPHVSKLHAMMKTKLSWMNKYL